MVVKICGITRIEDALLAAQAGADFVGLIQADGPRHVSFEKACQIAAELPPAVAPVLVFRDAPLATVRAALAETEFRWVQLHGAEPPSYAGELLRHLPELGVIRAWEVVDAAAADRLGAYLKGAADVGVRIDVVLLDAPKGAPHPGYACLGEVSRRCAGLADEIWCAGGLDADNVAGAVAMGQYAGVDTARGVEASPGIKDRTALQRFVDTAKRL